MVNKSFKKQVDIIGITPTLMHFLPNIILCHIFGNPGDTGLHLPVLSVFFFSAEYKKGVQAAGRQENRFAPSGFLMYGNSSWESFFDVAFQLDACNSLAANFKSDFFHTKML